MDHIERDVGFWQNRPTKPCLRLSRSGKRMRGSESLRGVWSADLRRTSQPQTPTCLSFGRQSGRTSAPTLPQRVHTIREHSERTDSSSGQWNSDSSNSASHGFGDDRPRWQPELSRTIAVGAIMPQ